MEYKWNNFLILPPPVWKNAMQGSVIDLNFKMREFKTVFSLELECQFVYRVLQFEKSPFIYREKNFIEFHKIPLIFNGVHKFQWLRIFPIKKRYKIIKKENFFQALSLF